MTQQAPNYKITVIIGNRGYGKTGTFIRIVIPEYILERFPQFRNFKCAIIDLEENYNYEKFECLTDKNFSKERKEILKRFCSQPVPIKRLKNLPHLNSGVFRFIPGEDEYAGAFADNVMKAIVYDKRIKEMLICIEDAARLMPDNNTLDTRLRDMIINAKQRKMDIVLFFHFWSDVPPKLLKWVDVIYLHKCDESAMLREKNITEIKLNKIIAAEQRLKASSNKYAHEKIILNA